MGKNIPGGRILRFRIGDDEDCLKPAAIDEPVAPSEETEATVQRETDELADVTLPLPDEQGGGSSEFASLSPEDSSKPEAIKEAVAPSEVTAPIEQSERDSPGNDDSSPVRGHNSMPYGRSTSPALSIQLPTSRDFGQTSPTSTSSSSSENTSTLK